MVPGGRFENIDLVVVRENLEGLYVGHEHYIQIENDPHAVAMATGINTRQGSRQVLDFAFQQRANLAASMIAMQRRIADVSHARAGQ